MTDFLPHWHTLAVLVLCAATSAAIAVDEILHSPDMPTFRESPVYVRLAMMAWSICLGYRAADLALSWWHTGAPQPIALSAVIGAAAMFACSLARLWDTFSKRLPAKTWRRLNRIFYLAGCGRRGKALAQLALQGVPVAAPAELGASDLFQPPR